MSIENDYRELCSGRWAELNPSSCPCHGHGWFLSDLDTWHQCPVHGKGVPHPEDEHAEFDSRAHFLKQCKMAFTIYRARFVSCGHKAEDFRALCARVEPSTPSEWVSAAERVCLEVESELAEEAARAAGFSCALEARLAQEAMWERKERALGLN